MNKRAEIYYIKSRYRAQSLIPPQWNTTVNDRMRLLPRLALFEANEISFMPPKTFAITWSNGTNEILVGRYDFYLLSKRFKKRTKIGYHQT